jgi:DNA ligase-1
VKAFTRLFSELDETTRTSEKLAALERYFAVAAPADAAWALAFLSGQGLPRSVTSRQLREWTAEAAGLPLWLVEECYEAVGDLAETMALLVPSDGRAKAPAEPPKGKPVSCASFTGDSGTPSTRQRSLSFLSPSTGGSAGAITQPTGRSAEMGLAQLVEQRLLPLAELDDASKRAWLIQTWRELAGAERFVWNKLITGGFRVGAARTLVVRALAKVAGVSQGVMAHRLAGRIEPTAEAFRRLLFAEKTEGEAARPYPFYLASPLEGGAEALGLPSEWRAEWKWDGIRAQLIRRGGEVVIWSRGDELVTESFPEIAEIGARLPEGTVLDGEILVWGEQGPRPFAHLQRRLGRKNPGVKLQRQFPAVFMAYDLLETNGRDEREQPMERRRTELERVVGVVAKGWRESTGEENRPRTATQLELGWVTSAERVSFTEPTPAPSEEGIRQDADQPSSVRARFPSLEGSGVGSHIDVAVPLRLSPRIPFSAWYELEQQRRRSRELGVEGVMLKRVGSAYGVGRVRGDWWKWKVDPFTIDAVLVGAQQGHGRRAGLFTDYTFALWQGSELVTMAKAYSGLTDDEINEVDAFVRANTTGRFGPVRGVKAELVFELAFEGIQESPRHKAGLALRFPRIHRWRRDKSAAEADTAETLRALMKAT